MSLTEEQIKHWFWNSNSEISGIKKRIKYPRYYTSNKYLEIDFDYTSLGAKRKKEIETERCKIFKESNNINYLSIIQGNVNQKVFDTICEIIELKGLFIQFSSIKNLDNIEKLKNLEHLYLWASPKIESINILWKMSSLITLELEQLNKIDDFMELSNLKQLEGLWINGSIWTSQKISTLEPLTQLKKLKYLLLENAKVQDASLSPILDLKELVRFSSARFYPESEFDKLKTLEKLKYWNIETTRKEIKKVTKQ